MYTLEINGTALVVTNADEDDARALLESDDFKADLRTLTADGQPLWDGSAAMNIRQASAEEVEAFDEALNDEDYDDESEDDDDGDDDPIDIVFLVEVDDEDEDEDEDEADGRNGATSA